MGQIVGEGFFHQHTRLSLAGECDLVIFQGKKAKDKTPEKEI